MLARPKFGFPPDEITALLAMFRRQGKLFRPEGLPPDLPDPDDAKFVHCAGVALAEYVVTGNKRHFPQAVYGATRVVSAAELLDRITFAI